MRNWKIALKTPRPRETPTLVQEEAGLHVGISADLPGAARHAAGVFREKYGQWRVRERLAAWGRYKREHFTVAVGGGNTPMRRQRNRPEVHSPPRSRSRFYQAIESRQPPR